MKMTKWHARLLALVIVAIITVYIEGVEAGWHVLRFGLALITVISIIVFVHEFGHYIVAKMSGIKIETFSIGFGNELFGWNDRSGTRWKVSTLPLGGYVKMFGDAT